MATTREQQVQRGYHYAIVDEVDSILIDEARTPLIISGPATVSTHQYDKWKPLTEQLVRKQNMLVNRVASEAKEFFEKGKIEEGGLAMFKVKLGQPRNKQLLRMMEDPEKRRAIEKAELSFLHRYAQGRTLRAQGRALLHHRREIERSRSLRTRPHLHESGRSGCLRAARPDQRVHRHRS